MEGTWSQLAKIAKAYEKLSYQEHLHPEGGQTNKHERLQDEVAVCIVEFLSSHALAYPVAHFLRAWQQNPNCNLRKLDSYGKV